MTLGDKKRLMKEAEACLGFPTEIIEEGRVKVLVPKLKAFIKAPSDYAPSKAPVFYNPVMELNRDLAVLALQAHQQMLNREISVCEPLTGCGIRGIRFAAEVKGIKKVVINDINQKAYRLAKHNVQTSKLSKRVTVRNEEANRVLARYSAPRTRFDAIDIDPFGSPVRYMDSAVRALRNSGLLALTATDMAPLCGVNPLACVRKYGGKPLRTEYCHELAVRLLAGCLATIAARQDMGINVVFSHSASHYIRVYATIRYGARRADESLKNMGYVLHCFSCFHRETRKSAFFTESLERCSECGSRLSVAGPLWVGRLSDTGFSLLMTSEARQRMLRQKEKVRPILTLVQSEANGPATYYVLDKICDKLALPVPSVRESIRALNERGFRASQTHFDPKGIRTDAPSKEMIELVRAMVL